MDMDTKQESIGTRIRRARGYRNMGQASLARAIGLSPSSLSQIETGKTEDPASSIVRRIAQVLKVSTDFLHGMTDKIENEIQAAEAA